MLVLNQVVSYQAPKVAKYKEVRIHLDLSISEESYNVITTSNPFKDLVEVTLVDSFDMWTIPSDIYMSVPELYAFCQKWLAICCYDEEIDFDEWFKDYLKSEIDGLMSEKNDLTYYDSIKLYQLKKYLQLNNFRGFSNPVKFLKGCTILPEYSWALNRYSKKCRLYDNNMEEVLIDKAKRNYEAFVNYVHKINHLFPELVPRPEKFLTKVGCLENIDFNNPHAIMYFVNPFTLSDCDTNYVFLRKVFKKVGKSRETNYCLYNANLSL